MNQSMETEWKDGTEVEPAYFSHSSKKFIPFVLWKQCILSKNDPCPNPQPLKPMPPHLQALAARDKALDLHAMGDSVLAVPVALVRVRVALRF